MSSHAFLHRTTHSAHVSCTQNILATVHWPFPAMLLKPRHRQVLRTPFSYRKTFKEAGRSRFPATLHLITLRKSRHPPRIRLSRLARHANTQKDASCNVSKLVPDRVRCLLKANVARFLMKKLSAATFGFGSPWLFLSRHSLSVLAGSRRNLLAPRLQATQHQIAAPTPAHVLYEKTGRFPPCSAKIMASTSETFLDVPGARTLAS